MASKQKTVGRIEYEIEKSREESNWKKVAELAESLTLKSSNFENLVNFLIGESKLEQYLEEHPPIEVNIPKARTGLTDAKRYLQRCLEAGPKVDLAIDVLLLLSKLLYSQGYYEEALSNISKSGIDNITKRQLSNRLMKVVAESFAIKGLCLEKTPAETTSKFKAAERETQIIVNLTKAGDLALLYLQEVERTQGQTGGVLPQLSAGVTASPLPPNTEYRIGPILETALQRTPILLIKGGQINKAVGQYRKMLNAVETSSTQSLRQTLSRQLAEVLLRGLCEKDYTEYLPNVDKSSDFWKPKKYSGQSLFTPKDHNEEILLLLFISEAMAVRNAVLDRSPEFRDARIHSYNNVTAVYDLLTIALVRRFQYSILCETYERAMKFAFEEYHIWFQFALSLLGAGKYQRAFLVLKECSNLQSNNPLSCLLMAKICYEHLNDPKKGLKMAEEALSRELAHTQGFLSRCHLTVGIGLDLLSDQARPQPYKQQLRARAFESFLKAQNTDPNDHLAEFYIALHYAQARQIMEAVQHAKAALALHPEHVHSLHLLVLLLSAQKQYEEALQLLDATLEEYPDNLNLLYTKAHLEEQCRGGEVALLTSKLMLRQWKALYTSRLNTITSEQSIQRVASDTKSVFQFYTSEFSDNESGGHSNAAVSRIEQALSEVASSLSGLQPRPGPHSVWLLQLHMWLLVAELYLHLSQPSEAEACIHEASTIFPLSHQLMVMKGIIHEYKKEFYEAKICFQNAVSINPVHVKALQHLGLVYHYLGSSHLAEKTLRDAVAVDPMSHQSWFTLGRVLQDTGDNEAAARCILTAIDLEATSPILPFSYITKTMD